LAYASLQEARRQTSLLPPLAGPATREALDAHLRAAHSILDLLAEGLAVAGRSSEFSDALREAAENVTVRVANELRLVPLVVASLEGTRMEHALALLNRAQQLASGERIEEALTEVWVQRVKQLMADDGPNAASVDSAIAQALSKLHGKAQFRERIARQFMQRANELAAKLNVPGASPYTMRPVMARVEELLDRAINLDQQATFYASRAVMRFGRDDISAGRSDHDAADRHDPSGSSTAEIRRALIGRI